ncbi:hypothetical protein ACFSWD_21830 [Paenibacillus xanthanilyticus]
MEAIDKLLGGSAVPACAVVFFAPSWLLQARRKKWSGHLILDGQADEALCMLKRQEGAYFSDAAGDWRFTKEIAVFLSESRLNVKGEANLASSELI